MIPKTKREELEKALARFDQELRGDDSWERRENHKYAIDFGGRRYPVKEIIRLATGYSSFGGGDEANGYVRQYGFDTVELRGPSRRQVWWVNQGRAHEEEKAKSFLFAGLKDKAGRSQVSWNTLADVRKGDVVVHYYQGNVKALSRALAECQSARRPQTSDGDGARDDAGPEGRLVKVDYYELRNPIPIDAIGAKIAALNIKEGPIERAGTAAKQGYLWRFSGEGLKVLREASSEAWPAWAESVWQAATGATPRIVKIAPGRNARYWAECLKGGYICVGWDATGDLLAYATEEEFKSKFAELFAERYHHNNATLSQKSREVGHCASFALATW